MRRILEIVPALAIATLVAIMWPPAAYGSHKTFAFDVDRFELTGNVVGSFVDEFDDGNIIPPWYIRATVIESGGVVTLQNPGYHDDIVFPTFTIELDRSDIVLQTAGSGTVYEGGGDFLATSSWVPVIPGPTEFFGLWFAHPLEDETIVATAILYGYADPTSASLISIPSGLVVLAFEYDLGYGGVATSFSAEAFSFVPSEVTGSVELRLGYDDANALITKSYSLDGGDTFTDFSPIASRMPAGAGGWFGLVADPLTVVAEPTCGNGTIGGDEQCDDGSTTPDDGCDASCQIETGWICTGEPSICTEHILPTLSPWSQLALMAGLDWACGGGGGARVARRKYLRGRRHAIAPDCAGGADGGGGEYFTITVNGGLVRQDLIARDSATITMKGGYLGTIG
jgi:cysteine-rich repeat protein